MRRVIAFLPLLALLLTSCGVLDEAREQVISELNDQFDDDYYYDDYDYDYDYGLFLSDFDDACSGAAVEGGTAYSEESGVHPVAIFDRDSDYDAYYNTSYILPDSWEADWETPEETELVVCLTTIPGEFVEACDYDIEGEAYTLNNYSASYEVELHEAATGELVDSTTLDIPAEECPMFWFFYELEEDYYPAYDQPLTDWVKPYVQN